MDIEKFNEAYEFQLFINDIGYHFNAIRRKKQIIIIKLPNCIDQMAFFSYIYINLNLFVFNFV